MLDQATMTELTAEISALQIDYSSPTHQPDRLARYNSCTFDEHKLASLVVFPTSVEQVQSFICLINRLNNGSVKLRVYTISTGQNWGYGSATPTSDCAILLCLKYLNSRPCWASNHLDTDQPYGKKLGIVKIEAGVTQQQLYDFLQQEGGQFWMDATGSSASCSVVGNTLERGFGHTPYGDHFDHVAGMQVLLADGTLVNTGHAGCQQVANVGVHKHGMGPIVEGLFSQSNLGIVTAIYLQLMPAKKYVHTFFIKLDSSEDFYQAVERLRPLKLNGTLPSQMHCGNAHKGIQAIMRYPFAATNNKTPLPDEIAAAIAKDNDISCWTISGALYSNSRLEVIAAKRQLRSSLSGLGCRLILLSSRAVSFIKSATELALVKTLLPSVVKKMRAQLTILEQLVKLKHGIPTDYFIDSMYWRKKDPVDDPLAIDSNDVGLLWLAPIAPMTAENLRWLIDVTETSFNKYGFEPAISVTLLNERALECIISIVFDKSVEQDRHNALRCHDELMVKFTDAGFTPYRTSVRAMDKDQLNFSQNLQHLHSLLKDGLDPHGVLSPNHYLKNNK